MDGRAWWSRRREDQAPSPWCSRGTLFRSALYVDSNMDQGVSSHKERARRGCEELRDLLWSFFLHIRQSAKGVKPVESRRVGVGWLKTSLGEFPKLCFMLSQANVIVALFLILSSLLLSYIPHIQVQFALLNSRKISSVNKYHLAVDVIEMGVSWYEIHVSAMRSGLFNGCRTSRLSMLFPKPLARPTPSSDDAVACAQNGTSKVANDVRSVDDYLDTHEADEFSDDTVHTEDVNKPYSIGPGYRKSDFPEIFCRLQTPTRCSEEVEERSSSFSLQERASRKRRLSFEEDKEEFLKRRHVLINRWCPKD